MPDFFLLPQADGTYTRFDYEQKEKPPAAPAFIAIHTLMGLVTYIRADLDARGRSGEGGKAWPNHMINVINETTVQLTSALHPLYATREHLVQAAFESLIGNTKFQFGTFLSLETCVIGLLSLFEDTEGRATLLSVLGNVNDKDVKTVTDDGVSQEVTVQMGPAMKDRATLAGDVRLRPFRTFREVEQPESSFRVRLKSGAEGGLPTVALFETDGGAWRLTAIESIASWLSAELGSVITIIA